MGDPRMYPSAVNQNANPVVTKVRRYSQTITPAEVATIVVAEQDFTVTGVAAGDVLIGMQAAATGNASGVIGGRVKAANTISISFTNPTAGALTPGAGTYEFLVYTYE